MREVKKTSKFKRDYRREEKSQYGRFLKSELYFILNLLCHDIPLPSKFHDHPLKGSLLGARDCHLRPDLILIYRKIGDDVLLLEQLGSHSEIL